MKKIIGIIIASLFILGAASVPARQDTATPTTQPQPASRVFTHAVFAEDATATWCGYCHFAREALDNIYKSGDYPFYYVCNVDDKNTHAAARNTEYNVQGFPTVFFDGGYNVQVGGYSGNENAYRNVIQSIGSRSVADINTSLNVTWFGSGNMDITVTITNNMSSQYVGKLKVYVAEPKSSFGWVDTTGHKYTMAFLDYAQNQDVSISGGSTWTNTYNWLGANHNDGYGHNFASIEYGNIEVIATVFNATWHQGYSYPPGQGPFNAFYPDDCVGFQVGVPVNHPPAKPSSPSPANGATNVALNKDISWSCTDPDEEDTLYFDVYFGTTNPPPKVATHQTKKSWDTGTMSYATTYYWKVNVTDNLLYNESPIWSFTTGTEPDTTPPTVAIEKPLPGYLYINDNAGRKRVFFSNTLVIKSLTITVNASDNNEVNRVDFYIDNELQTSVFEPPYTYLWEKAGGFFPKTHVIKVIAYDQGSNSANAAITVAKML
jgi:glutaredoxin